MSTSWIIFNDPPSKEEILFPDTSAIRWTTTLLPTHKAEELNPELGGVIESEEDEGDEMEYSSWRHEQDEITGSDTTETSFARPTCSILPPPRHTQNRDITMHNNTTFYNETTTSTSLSCSQIAPPPNYPWKASTLTVLSSLSSTLSSHKVNYRSKSTPKVNLLVAVLSMTAPKSVGQNRVIRAEWKVVDQSGVEIGVVLWQETAESWCEAVKVGDVIFLGGISLSSYRSQLQLTPSSNDSTIQICFRPSRPRDPDQSEADLSDSVSMDEEEYEYGEAYEDVIEEAASVGELVRWCREVYQNWFR